MMERIGESDITKIVDLFQKQSFTCNAWMEAVRDQEVMCMYACMYVCIHVLMRGWRLLETRR